MPEVSYPRNLKQSKTKRGEFYIWPLFIFAGDYLYIYISHLGLFSGKNNPRHVDGR